MAYLALDTLDMLDEYDKSSAQPRSEGAGATAPPDSMPCLLTVTLDMTDCWSIADTGGMYADPCDLDSVDATARDAESSNATGTLVLVATTDLDTLDALELLTLMPDDTSIKPLRASSSCCKDMTVLLKLCTRSAITWLGSMAVQKYSQLLPPRTLILSIRFCTATAK